MSRHDVVEPYLVAIRELGVSVLSKVVNMTDDTVSFIHFPNNRLGPKQNHRTKDKNIVFMSLKLSLNFPFLYLLS